jgi:hypothetical protein
MQIKFAGSLTGKIMELVPCGMPSSSRDRDKKNLISHLATELFPFRREMV